MDENKLVQENLGLVITIAKKFKPINHDEYSEYVQIGSIALLRAIRKFDPSRAKLSTFAWRYITKAILKYIIKQNKYKCCTGQLTNDISDKNNNLYLTEFLPNTLTPKERTIIQMRLENYTFEEIGKFIGCTRGWSNRLFNRAAKKIREEYAR